MTLQDSTAEPQITTLSPAERARRCADIMWADDTAGQELGIVLTSVGPGTAVCHWTVMPQHINGHEICHGGFIFTLADTAFAYACNSYNQCAVAQHNTITYVSSARLGDTLQADATEISRSGRSGVYDVIVINQNGSTIALFRGCCRTIRGQFFSEPAQP